jgi:CBS domain-containing protein
MLTARQVMRQPVQMVAGMESIAFTVREMQRLGISSLMVPPRFEDETFGIITKHDIIAKVVALGRDPYRVRVSEVMSTHLYTVEPDSTLQACAALMMRHHIRRLPVFANGQPVGIVSDSDVFDALLHFHTEAAASFSL